MIKRILSNHFIRFLLTGGLNTAFGYAIFSGLVFITNSSTLSVILANMLGILFNFKTYGKFVFNSKDNSLIFRFCGVYVFITLAQIFSLKLLKLAGVVNLYMAAGIVLLPMAATSFVLMRKFVFHQSLVPTEKDSNESEEPNQNQ